MQSVSRWRTVFSIRILSNLRQEGNISVISSIDLIFLAKM